MGEQEELEELAAAVQQDDSTGEEEDGWNSLGLRNVFLLFYISKYAYKATVAMGVGPLSQDFGFREGKEARESDHWH